MNWKRALLIIGAALLVWLRPWRRLLQPAASARIDPPAAPPGEADSPFPEVVPVAPLNRGDEAPEATAEPVAVPPEDAFGVAASDEPPPALADDAAVPALAAMDDLAPEAAFAAPGPELIVGDDLDAALDLAEEPEQMRETVAVGAPGILEFADDDRATVPGSVAEPDAELEPELIALGEPELVEMAEDDLIAVPSTGAAEMGSDSAGDDEARAVGEPAAPPDDLLVIEGIGPRVSTIVTAAGFTSFADLAAADVERLREVLSDAGIKTVDPTTWPEQARIAADGRWDELRELQRTIKNGKKG